MNIIEKQTFIHNLIDSVCKELMEKAEKMPEEWDGHELRELIADKFDHERSMKRMGHRGRLKAYRNVCLTTNL